MSKSAAKLFENVINNSGNISLEFDPDELLIMVAFLKASKDYFNILSNSKDAKPEDLQVMKQYALIAEKLHSRFGAIATIGEPESKLLN